MEELANRPDATSIEVPTDAWIQPFWDAASAGELKFPRCGKCATFHWPPSPFCPNCRSQAREWMPAGQGRVYSFTVVRRPAGEGDAPPLHVPALIEFPDAAGMRILAAIVDSPIAAIKIGAAVDLGWNAAANTQMPVFSLAK